MSGEELAGRSAEQEAARHRRRNPVSAYARAFALGAVGERRTAAVLNPLSGDGWWVLHDLAVPGSDANIDHVVVGPGGVFVVDSKHWAAPTRQGGGTLWVGRHPKRHEVDTLLWELDHVRRALGSTAGVQPQAVISLTAAPPARPVLHAGGVSAVAVDDLVRHLAQRPTILRPEKAEMLARVLDGGLPSRSGAASSLVRPDPLPYRRPGPPRPPSLPPHRRPFAPARRVRTRPPLHLAAGALHRVAGVALIALAALLGLAVLGALLRAVPAGSVPHVAPAPPGPAPLLVRWSCPAGGAGWTATFSWPTTEPPPATWELQTGPGPHGPWRDEGTGRGSERPTLRGLRTGEHGWARAGTPEGLRRGGTPVMAGPVTVPQGC